MIRDYLPKLTIKTAAKVLSVFNGRIADVACGKGPLLRELNAIGQYSGKEIIGIDASQEQLNKAESAGMNVVQGDIFSMPFEDGMFDVAVCLNTLINFPSIDELGSIFREMTRIVHNKGIIVIDIRNKLNQVLRLKYWLHMRKRDFPTVSYSPEEIETAMRAVGCRLLRKKAVGISNSYLAWGYIMVFEKESGQK